MTAKEIISLQQRVSLFDDQPAFGRLFNYHYTALRQFAASIVKSREVAEEIVEDVFVSIWKNRSELTAISNFKVYLYVSVRNRCMNHINRNGGKNLVSLDNPDVVCCGLVSDPEDIMVVSEMLQAVNKAVNDLPPRCRLVYKLAKEDGLQYKEIAEILEISPRTVENQIAAAVKKLAAVLKVDFLLSLPVSTVKK